MFSIPFIKPRHRRAVRLFIQESKARFSPRRITPLTAFLWLALASDLAAPGYLVFHIGFTRLDIPAIAAEASAVSTTTGAE